MESRLKNSGATHEPCKGNFMKGQTGLSRPDHTGFPSLPNKLGFFISF